MNKRNWTHICTLPMGVPAGGTLFAEVLVERTDGTRYIATATFRNRTPVRGGRSLTGWFSGTNGWSPFEVFGERLVGWSYLEEAPFVHVEEVA